MSNQVRHPPHMRLKLARSTSRGKKTTSVTSVFVRAIARREGVKYRPTHADRWAGAVTRLAGDEVKSDVTDDRVVALGRAGKITAADALDLLVAHHRRVRSV